MPPKGGPQVHKRGNKIYLHKGGVKLDKTLPMQQKDRTARGGEVGFDEKSRRCVFKWDSSIACLSVRRLPGSDARPHCLSPGNS